MFWRQQYTKISIIIFHSTVLFFVFTILGVAKKILIFESYCTFLWPEYYMFLLEGKKIYKYNFSSGFQQ